MQQKLSAFVGLAAGGLFSVVMRQAVFKYKSTPKPILFLGMLTGFVVGANGATAQTSILSKAGDREIIRAFDERWVRSVLAVSGLLTNHTSNADQEENNNFSKPY